MLCDDGKSVALIDFGVSSLMNTDSTVLMTQTGMTPAYSAPETFRDLFMKESDYFSFGVLLFELYCGRTPYAGMSKDDVARYTAIQRIPLPEDMPVTLQNLIAALTYPDITNRGKTENPNRRWTYDEVKNGYPVLNSRFREDWLENMPCSVLPLWGMPMRIRENLQRRWANTGKKVSVCFSMGN